MDDTIRRCKCGGIVDYRISIYVRLLLDYDIVDWETYHRMWLDGWKCVCRHMGKTGNETR